MTFNETVDKLLHLVAQARHNELAYRNAISCLVDDDTKALFIRFWQDHSKIVSELEDKIRWLGGVGRLNAGSPPWGGLQFREDSEDHVIAELLQACENADETLLADYTYVLKMILPMDVRMLLKLHVLRLKAIQARVQDLRTPKAPSLMSCTPA